MCYCIWNEYIVYYHTMALFNKYTNGKKKWKKRIYGMEIFRNSLSLSLYQKSLSSLSLSPSLLMIEFFYIYKWYVIVTDTR